MANTYKGNIVWLDPHELIPYVNNAKQHPREQVEKIASSITEFGFDQPIVVDKDKVIIKGHGRREASLFLNLQAVPVLVRDDLSPAAVKAARLADNKVGESGWLDDMLRVEMEMLKDAGMDLSLTGFTDSEIDALLDAGKAAEDAALGDMPFGDDAMPDELPPPDFAGEDDRSGRFILVYESEEEKAALCDRLGINGDKVVYVVTELDSRQEESGEEEAA